MSLHVNACYTEKFSCSACCGLYNIRMNPEEKKNWMIENTRKFLNLNLSNREQVLTFRRSGEKFLKSLMIRPDVYICPFLGITGNTKNQTGCLLNPAGSPHDQVKNIEAPLSFSFYGESTCKSYDCSGKQNLNIKIPEKIQNSNPGLFTYGRFISNHNLLETCRKIIDQYPGLEKPLLEQVFTRLENSEIPVTSFEMVLSFECFTDEELWHVLGMMFHFEGYVFEKFQFTKKGEAEGIEFKSLFQV